MRHTYLGKPIPAHPRPESLPRHRRPSLILVAIAPFVLLASMVYLASAAMTASTPTRQVSFSGPTRYLAQTNPPQQSSGPCDPSNISATFNANTIFPLLPSVILNGPCTPPFWNIDIFKILAWKVLALLNWIAGVLAVCLTIYAGLLYLSGFANEANIKRAKSILMAAYIGLAIVILARVILYGTIQLFSNSGIDTSNATQQLVPPAGSNP